MPLYQPINYLNELPSETISKGFGLGLDAARTGAQIQQFKAAQAVSERELVDKEAAAARQKQFQNFLSTATTKEELIAGARLFPEFQKQIADQFSLESGVERQQMSEVFTQLRVASQNPDTNAGDMALARTIGDPKNAWIWERIGTDPTGAFEATRDRKQFGSLLNVAEMGLLLTPKEQQDVSLERDKFGAEQYYKGTAEERAQAKEQRDIETHQQNQETAELSQEKTRGEIDKSGVVKNELQLISNATLNDQGVMVDQNGNKIVPTTKEGFDALKGAYTQQKDIKETRIKKSQAEDSATELLGNLRRLQANQKSGNYTGWQNQLITTFGAEKYAGSPWNDMYRKIDQITTTMTALGDVLPQLGITPTDSDFQNAKTAATTLAASNSDEEFQANLKDAIAKIEKLQRRIGGAGGAPAGVAGQSPIVLDPNKANLYGGGS